MKIYFDENASPYFTRGLNEMQKPLNRQQKEEIEVVFLSDVFGKGAKDEEWIPVLGDEGSVVITQDQYINRIRNQKELYIKHGLGVIFISPPSKTGFLYWDFVQLVIKHWAEIRKIALKEKRPFAFKFSAKGNKAESLL
ncbi:MAG: hypothetical protein IT270_12630 [Saprospiraceae bacterium]|nr:hypothetical protein [Saprospiraceae bacterium]